MEMAMAMVVTAQSLGHRAVTALARKPFQLAETMDPRKRVETASILSVITLKVKITRLD